MDLFILSRSLTLSINLEIVLPKNLKSLIEQIFATWQKMPSRNYVAHRLGNFRRKTNLKRGQFLTETITKIEANAKASISLIHFHVFSFC